jgi:hypothetical protein
MTYDTFLNLVNALGFSPIHDQGYICLICAKDDKALMWHERDSEVFFAIYDGVTVPDGSDWALISSNEKCRDCGVLTL